MVVAAFQVPELLDQLIKPEIFSFLLTFPSSLCLTMQTLTQNIGVGKLLYSIEGGNLKRYYQYIIKNTDKLGFFYNSSMFTMCLVLLIITYICPFFEGLKYTFHFPGNDKSLKEPMALDRL